MRFILIAILLFSLLEGGFEWSAYKETLFVGEPIVLILKFKNTGNEPVKIPWLRARYPENRFDLIFREDTFRYFPGYSPKRGLRTHIDSGLITTGDSVYTYTLLFWKDFGRKENKPLYPKQGEKCKIWVNQSDTVSLFFVEPPNEELKVFEAVRNFHEAIRDGGKYRKWLLKNFLRKKGILAPYLYFINFRWGKLPTEIKTVKEMKNQFPGHILTEWAEIDLMWRLYTDEDPKNKKAAIEMYKELSKKYPFNISVRKELKVSPKTLRSKPKLKRKTLIERFRWEIKKTLRWLKMTYYRLAWKTEIMLKRILKWLKKQRTETSRMSDSN